MNRQSTLLIIVLSLWCVTCKTEEDILPRATQDGQNTFGCLVDGNSYIPSMSGSWSGIKAVYGGFTSTTAGKRGIHVSVYSKDKQSMTLFLNDIRLGQHLLNQNPGTSPDALYAALYSKDYGYYRSTAGESFATSAKYTGWINISKADTTTGVVAGTFEFQAATVSGKTVTITKGRFDVNPRTQ